MAVTNNFTIYKGEAVVLPFQHVVDGTTTPAPINGRTMVFTLKRKETDSVALLTVSPTVTNDGQGLYQVPLTHAQTVALAARDYYCDVQFTDPGSEATISIGRFTVLQEVLYR